MNATENKNTPSQIKNDLKSTAIFKGCGDDFLSKITANAQYQSHNKGKILFLHEDKATRFYYIKKGWIKLFRETLDGTQAVVNVLDTGHIFGETAMFEDNLYPYSAEMIEQAEIISLPLSDLKTEIKINNKLALNMLTAMAYSRRRQDKEIEHRALQNAPQRIGCFLLRLADQNQKEPVIIHLPYDKTLIAARLGMQPETFSRALAKLREKTGIHVKGATVEMDSLEQLTNYTCTACSSEFPCKDLQTAKN